MVRETRQFYHKGRTVEYQMNECLPECIEKNLDLITELRFERATSHDTIMETLPNSIYVYASDGERGWRYSGSPQALPEIVVKKGVRGDDTCWDCGSATFQTLGYNIRDDQRVIGTYDPTKNVLTTRDITHGPSGVKVLRGVLLAIREYQHDVEVPLLEYETQPLLLVDGYAFKLQRLPNKDCVDIRSLVNGEVKTLQDDQAKRFKEIIYQYRNNYDRAMKTIDDRVNALTKNIVPIPEISRGAITEGWQMNRHGTYIMIYVPVKYRIKYLKIRGDGWGIPIPKSLQVDIEGKIVIQANRDMITANVLLLDNAHNGISTYHSTADGRCCIGELHAPPKADETAIRAWLPKFQNTMENIYVHSLLNSSLPLRFAEQVAWVCRMLYKEANVMIENGDDEGRADDLMHLARGLWDMNCKDKVKGRIDDKPMEEKEEKK